MSLEEVEFPHTKMDFFEKLEDTEDNMMFSFAPTHPNHSHLQESSHPSESVDQIK